MYPGYYIIVRRNGTSYLEFAPTPEVFDRNIISHMQACGYNVYYALSKADSKLINKSEFNLMLTAIKEQ